MSAVSNVLAFLCILYFFFLAIKLMGSSSKSLGLNFARNFLGESGSSAILGLIVGIFTTSIVQSSSTVTSMVVGFVASGAFTIRQAIPVIMGANIGTTITTAIVTLGHVHRRREFRRAFAAGTVHDIFNILSVIVLFPLEQSTHILEKTAIWMSDFLIGQDIGEFDGLKNIVNPVIHQIKVWVPNNGLCLALSLLMLFIAMALLVKLMRSMMENRIAHLIDSVFFRNMGTSIALGTLVTILVQSSSVTTSLIVPLVGGGIIQLEQAFPYLLGANIGTTTTALLASLAFAATGSAENSAKAALGVTTAIVHMLFNVLGILIWYPLRIVPINLSKKLAALASKSRRNTILIVISFFALYLLPLGIYILLR
ncbi:MAG: Na/Pi cotransporter family protein [bacterium]|nr:Na/Pi cotransporter family protein [bacterium]